MNPLSVLRDSLYFFRRHLPSILQLCLPLVVLEALLTQLLYRQMATRPRRPTACWSACCSTRCTARH